MELAVREGVDAVSIRRIASACAISIGSVYNYYTNKETLVSDVASRFWNGILLDQEKLYHDGMRFTMFLEQYYLFLYGRLSQYDKSWLMGESGQKIRFRFFIKRWSRMQVSIAPSGIWN